MANEIINNDQAPADNNDCRRALAPSKLDINNPAYKSVEELSHAISLSQCKNIALTGVYGSGKSSVIDTYLALDCAPKKVLRISLSNFEDSKVQPDQEISYENEIEFKLFQHIIYKANADKTRRSQYKRLHVADNRSIKKVCRSTAIFCLCFIIVFEPKILQIDAFYQLYYFIFASWSYWVNIISDIIASCIMSYIAYNALGVLIKKYSDINIASLKAKDIEINFKDEKSVFNKLLDEILYYFKSGEYELIVFEDLDRISDPKKLFLKLREINILLNESDYYISRKSQIKFLYAIKDDIFEKEVRTKCFDYLIPVIPVINSFNAGEYLLSNYQRELNGISITDVKRLGGYISSMRELTNIMNEYMLYSTTILRESMSAKKLFAITIYKNLYPHDYSGVHTKEGVLYNAFKNKSAFSEPLVKEKREEIKQRIDSIKKEREAITSVRQTVLDWFTNHDGITDLVINGIRHSLSEIAKTDSLFNSFRHDKVERWIIDVEPDPETGKYDYHFKDILAEVDPDGTFDESIDSHERSISKDSDRKRTLEKQILTIEGKSLCELMKLSGDGNSCKELLQQSIACVDGKDKDEIINTLHAMILSGYISDDYSTYISYTYTGSFDEQDFKFQQSVIQGIPLEYTYSLNHIDAFIDNLYSENFDHKCILNNDLLNYLLKGNKAAFLDSFILTSRKNLDFVVQFDSLYGKNDRFLKALFGGWTGCVKYISEVSNNDIRSYMLHLFFRYSPTDIQLSTEEIDFIGTQYKFIAEDFENCNIKSLNDFFRYNRAIFENLVEPNSVTQPLFDSIVCRNQFQINYTNLRLIYGEDFETKTYSTIISRNDSIKAYVLRDMDRLLSIIPDNDVDESIEAIISLSNDNHVSDDAFEKILSRQNRIIPSFDNVNSKRIPIFFRTDKIAATWDNVKKYFAEDDDPQGIVPFIIKHANELSKIKIVEDEDKTLQLLLMDNNTLLPFEVFKSLLPCCGYYFAAKEISSLNDERLMVILNEDYIEYNMGTKELYASKGDKIWGEYLVHFFDKFIEDENFGIKIPNNTAIHILNSDLTIDQKKYFLDKMASPLDEDGLSEYSRIICFYYQQMSIDDNTDCKLLLKALRKNDGLVDWKQKIDLVNRINDYYPYDKTHERELLLSLGGEYMNLSSYRGVSHFDDNIENRTLLNYLLEKGHYVNKIKEEDGRLKVTFKNPPSEE